jgi:hypothetical protein
MAGKTADDAGGIRLSRHPRATRDIRRAKGWGGLVAFVAVFWLGHRAGLATADAIVRALLGGVVGYVLAWAGAVAVWKHLALAEMEDAKRRIRAEYERLEAERQERAAAA